MMKREVAWRVFAAEYNSSSMEMKGEEERAPSYIITPLGAMINRLFVIGVMTDVENMGTTEEPMWRGRISDPTGTFYVSAGQYQPEAALAMSKIKPPAFIAVIGKSRTYSPEEGTIYVSIRPERIAAVDERMRDAWVLETCKLTLERISALEDALEMETPSAEEMVKLGHGKSLAEGVVKSLPHYQGLELDRYRTMVVDALRYLIPEYRIEAGVPQSVADVPDEIEEEEKEDIDTEEGTIYVSIRPERIAAVDERMRDHWVLETCKLTLERISALEDALEMETPSAEEMVKLGHGKSLAEGVVKSLSHYQDLELDRYRTMVVDALRYLIPEYRIEAEVPQSVAEAPEEIEEEEKEDIDKEEKVLGIIDKLDKKGKGAPWDEIVEETGKSGIDKSELEELTNSLLDKGLIYEPVLGKMKRI